MIDGIGALDYFAEWGEYGEEDDLALPISLFPDIELKRGGSGTGGVLIVVPNGRADAPIVIGNDHDWVYPFGESLVGYLRVSILSRGGFPCHPCPQWTLSPGEEEYRGQVTHLDTLVQGLIPF